jgi:peptidoglycan/LPS O-acetylase OafA/YrhL
VLDRVPVHKVAVEDSANIPQHDERRIAYLDTLRGLASVQVLLSHSMLAFFAGIAMAKPSSGTFVGYLAASPLFLLIDGASAVCIFFFLSGYVLTSGFTHSRASNGAIIGSRFLRLAIPAAAGCAFSAILFQALGSYHETAAVVSKSLWLADGWRPAADLWFLRDAVVNGVILGFQGSSLAQWVGVPATSLAAMENSYVTPLWTLSIEFYGSCLVLLLARSRSQWLLVLAALVFSRTYLVCFIVGHVAARLDLGGKRLLMAWPLAAAAAVSGLAICLVSHFWSPAPIVSVCALGEQILPPCPLDKPDYLMRIYGASLFGIGVLQSPWIRKCLSSERLRALGPLSFPIYLTHWPVIFGLGSFSLVEMTPWIGTSSSLALAARLLALLMSIAVTILAATYFEPIDQIALRASRAWRKRNIVVE